MKHIKIIIAASVVVALASQISIGFMNDGFRVSAGIIFLSLLLFHYRDLKPVSFGIISGTAVYLLRLAIYFLANGDFASIIFSFQLEILFYTFFGIIYSLLIKRVSKEDINKFSLVVAFSDFFANLIELLARIALENTSFELRTLMTLLLVAAVRSGIVWCVLNGLKYYRMLLLKEEHEKRYNRLLWLTAQLKSEMYWMGKNMDNIESIMSNSYTLFEKISHQEDRDSWADMAVTIAMDVHEIKKEYGLVIRGINELTEDKLQDEGMDFKDIIRILDEAMKREIKHVNKNIDLSFEISGSFYTPKHFYLMSIFRNLIMNSIDAVPSSAKTARISFTHKIDGEDHVFMVSDTGCGIDEEDLEHIFPPGFSTKINYETGEINRGLGLSVVQDIVQSHFKGRLEVSSEKGEGTTFWVYIPRSSVEVVA